MAAPDAAAVQLRAVVVANVGRWYAWAVTMLDKVRLVYESPRACGAT